VEQNQSEPLFRQSNSYKFKKYINLGINTSIQLFVPRGTNNYKDKTYTHIVNIYLAIFPLFMGLFSIISILWTTSPQIATYRSIKFTGFILLYYHILYTVPRGTTISIHSLIDKLYSKLFHVEHSKKTKRRNGLENKQGELFVLRGTNILNIVYIIIFSVTINAIIGIYQFLTKHSIGLFWLKEAKISPELPGIAKVILDNTIHIRAYGLLPHPNILGGWIVLSIIFSIMLKNLFHVEQISNNDHNLPKTICSTWNKYLFSICNHIFSWRTLIMLQCLALILTFSKSAIIGLFLGLLYIKIKERTKLFHVEQLKNKLYLGIILLLLVNLIQKINTYSLFIKSLQEREIYLAVSTKIITLYPLFGIGSGQFVPYLSNLLSLPDWQYQPVHNVFMLLSNEYGIILLIGFIIFLYLLLQDSFCSTWNKNSLNGDIYIKIHLYMKGALLSFIFIMLFDHYLWDIQQGQILLWILLGCILSIRNRYSKEIL
jgi:hypothetical protein